MTESAEGGQQLHWANGDEAGARESIHRVARRVKRAESSLYSALRSIHRDSSFVLEIANLWPTLPLLPNLRCGLWYAPPQSWRPPEATCCFKSTDGHTGNWSFSLSRLNLHVASLAAEQGGCIVVDATRRGKLFPDALSKTVPIWCCVLNCAIDRIRMSLSPPPLMPPLPTPPVAQELMLCKSDVTPSQADASTGTGACCHLLSRACSPETGFSRQATTHRSNHQRTEAQLLTGLVETPTQPTDNDPGRSRDPPGQPAQPHSASDCLQHGGTGDAVSPAVPEARQDSRGQSLDADAHWDCSLHVPWRWVSPSEAQSISSRVPLWASSLLSVAPQDHLLSLADTLTKPFRPLWVSQRSVIWTNQVPPPDSLPFTPLVLVSASEPALAGPAAALHRAANGRGLGDVGGSDSVAETVEGGKRRGGVHHDEKSEDGSEGEGEGLDVDDLGGWNYIPGAADDEETWGRGLTPKLFWSNCAGILGAGAHRCNSVVARIVEDDRVRRACRGEIAPQVTVRKDKRPKGQEAQVPLRASIPAEERTGSAELLSLTGAPVAADAGGARGGSPCSWLADTGVGIISAHSPALKGEMVQASAVLGCGVNATPQSPDTECLNLPIRSCKSDRLSLLQHLPAAVEFGRKHLTQGRTLLVVCPSGTDLGVCVSLAILLKAAEENLLTGCRQWDKFVRVSELKGHLNTPKDAVRVSLAFICTHAPEARPSRGNIKQVAMFFQKRIEDESECESTQDL